MICQICSKNGADFSTACGHTYHHKCFADNCLQRKDWNLTCNICQCSLAHCHFDPKNGECYVGLHSNNTFISLYEITRESKIIVGTNKHWLKWTRDNGRLQSRQIFPLKYNISVT